MATYTIVEDWTGPYQLQLLSNGNPVDVTGFYVIKVFLWPKAGTGTPKEFSRGTGSNGKLQVDDSANGLISLLPNEGDILVAESPYWLQVEVWWSATQHSVYPSALPPHRDGVILNVYARAE